MKKPKIQIGILKKMFVMSIFLPIFMGILLVYISLIIKDSSKIISSQRQILQQLNQNETATSLKISQEIIKKLSEIRFWLYDYALTNKEVSKDRADEIKLSLDEILQTYSAMYPLETIDLNDEIDQMYHAIGQASNTYASNNREKGKKLLDESQILWERTNNTIFDVYTNAQKKFSKEEEIRQQAEKTLEEKSLQTLSTNKKILSTSLYLIPISVIIGLAFSIVFSTRVKKNISQAMALSTKLARGDLTKNEVKQTHDEMGTLVWSIHLVSEKLAHIVLNIFNRSRKINLTSEELSSLANKMLDKSQKIKSDMDSLVYSVEESSSHVGDTSEAADRLCESAKEMSMQTSLVKNITCEAVNKVSQSTKSLRLLGEAADEIGGISQAIDDISERTKLLALNANIEAARAGEFGQEFRIVANEIKELADNVHDSTLEIREKIANMQHSVAENLEQFLQISKVISNLKSNITKISNSVDLQKETTEVISENMHLASDNLKSVLKIGCNTENRLTSLAKDIYKKEISQEEKSLDLMSCSDKLSVLGDKLYHLVKKFKL